MDNRDWNEFEGNKRGSGNEWEHFGNDIRDIVRDATRSQDYTRLKQTISNVIDDAKESVNKTVREAENFADKMNQSARKDSQARYSHGAQSQDGQRIRFNDRWVNEPAKKPAVVRGPYIKTASMTTKGVCMTVGGAVLAMGFGSITFSFLLMALTQLGTFTASAFSYAVSAVLGLISLGCVGLTVYGVGILRRVGRFKNYIRLIKNHGYCQISELAQRMGKPVNFIKKDLKKMLQKGMFLEGHMDKNETCLIVTKEAYQQYQDAQKQLEERQRQEQEKQKEQAAKASEQAKYSPEVQAVLEKGNYYIRRIRECNDAIPGEEVSNKMSRMELIIKKIFQRAKEHPEIIPELQKMMDYYLPTTVKLLEAYEDLDGQPVQGENITASKKEIEGTLDTLNAAFEKLLDSIFKDTAWDISTDISVLNTLLAQEGLTKDDFKGV